VLCGNIAALIPKLGDDFMQFEVPLTACGSEPATIANDKEGGNDAGSLGFFSCGDPLKSLQGIDIVFGCVFGIELKKSSETVNEKQVRRYCRFGAFQGLHTILFAYINLPEVADNDKYALWCWSCWSKGDATDLDNCSPSKSSKAGSIYFAWGFEANSKSTHFYKPSPSLLGCK